MDDDHYQQAAKDLAPKGKTWIFVAFLASLLFTASCVIRGVESENFLTTKALLCIASCSTGLIYMIYMKVTGQRLPWNQPTADDGSVYEFKPNLLLVLMLRGVFEFGGSLLYLYSLKIALDSGVNQGICSAMITMAGLMITIMSWVVYDERLNFPQLVGMASVLSAIAFMGIFQEDVSTDQTVVESIEDNSTTQSILMITLYANLAALSFSFEAILIKWLVVRGVQGTDGGYLTLFFDGLYGMILLAGLFYTGNEGLNATTRHDLISILVGGYCTSLALVCVNYSVANGIAGISFSMANSFPAYHALFNRTFLDQMLSTGQIGGVLLALSGGVILSIPEKLDCCPREENKKDSWFAKSTVDEDQK